MESWHAKFSPKHFLAKVNIDKFIEHNEAYNENKVDRLENPCILCRGYESPGLLLNDKSYLCKKCFTEISSIQYPEKYERQKREFIKEREARHQAREAFIQSCPYRKIYGPIGILVWVSLALLYLNILFIAAPVTLFLIYKAAKKEHGKRLQQWESLYPKPVGPELRHFHDPLAILTSRDKAILKVFNNWPGYPPFWNYLRLVVMERDGNRCQVSGCPSRTELHIHHKIPVSQGGEHVPKNLITLCCFHHALEPDEGHERIWGDIKTRYFTMVHAHKRRNPSSPGYHDVRAHVRRLELISKSDLSEIINYYGLSCPSCNNKNLTTNISKQKQQVAVNCLECSNSWIGPRKLSEETGPRLAEVLAVTKNKGEWHPRWDMIEERSDSTFRLFKGVKSKSRKKTSTIASKKSSAPKCPKCGSDMRLIKPKPGQHWRAFWGCTKYRISGCSGSIDA
ncbi:MAG: HNH endonuclease signature motif containing protein [Deltaproteobacteria bacterium]|nr:HNH endonuclease signature motif containing protein [Deltaproteobacteria bacterium]